MLRFMLIRAKEGRSNWDIVKASADTAQVAPADTASFNSAIDIRNIELIRANLTFDDRDTRVYARMDSYSPETESLVKQGALVA